jgi:hypothetical protein
MTINILNNIILERTDEYGKVQDVNFPNGSTLVGTVKDTLVEEGTTYTTIQTSDGYYYVGLDLDNTDFFSVV